MLVGHLSAGRFPWWLLVVRGWRWVGSRGVLGNEDPALQNLTYIQTEPPITNPTPGQPSPGFARWSGACDTVGEICGGTNVAWFTAHERPRRIVHMPWSKLVTTPSPYIPRPMRAETSLSATACGSCLAISIQLSNFFTPIFNAGDCPSSRPNPASWSMATACLVPAALLKSSTSVRTCSRDSMVEIGGTRSSESKFSENPRSVRIECEEEVAMMRRRRP